MAQGKNFRYLQFDTVNGRGYACVSFTWTREGDRIGYEAGIAFCSPSDKFRKDIARLKAEARRAGSTRLKSQGKRVASEITSTNPTTNFISNEEFGVIFDDILIKCEDSNVVPKWLWAAYNEGSFRFGLREQELKTKMSDNVLKGTGHSQV